RERAGDAERSVRRLLRRPDQRAGAVEGGKRGALIVLLPAGQRIEASRRQSEPVGRPGTGGQEGQQNEAGKRRPKVRHVAGRLTSCAWRRASSWDHASA